MIKALSAIGATRDVEYVTNYIVRRESNFLTDIFKCLHSSSIEIQAQTIKVKILFIVFLYKIVAIYRF